jgi:hypothetical protein
MFGGYAFNFRGAASKNKAGPWPERQSLSALCCGKAACIERAVTFRAKLIELSTPVNPAQSNLLSLHPTPNPPIPWLWGVSMMIQFFKALLLAIVVAACSLLVTGQTCVTSGEVKTMVAGIDPPANVTLNKKLREELMKLRYKDEESLHAYMTQLPQDEKAKLKLGQAREKTSARLC